MNGHCSTCDVEAKCAYQYKPCDCCNYRKFVHKLDCVDSRNNEPIHVQGSKVIKFPKEGVTK